MLNITKMQKDTFGKIEDIVKCSKETNLEALKIDERRLHGPIYYLKVVINDRWIGFDFTINKELTNGICIGESLDTDLYPLDFNTEVTQEIYDGVRNFLDDLAAGDIYYGTSDGAPYYLRPDAQNPQMFVVRKYKKGLLGTTFLSSMEHGARSRASVAADKSLSRVLP